MPSPAVTEDNRAIVEGLYAAAAAGDVEAVLASIDDDIVVREPPFLPYGKVYRGKEGFIELFGVVSEYLDWSGGVVHHTLADGDRVAACVGMPDRKTGELTRFIEHFTLRGGKVVEVELFYHDAGTMVENPKAV